MNDEHLLEQGQNWLQMRLIKQYDISEVILNKRTIFSLLFQGFSF